MSYKVKINFVTVTKVGLYYDYATAIMTHIHVNMLEFARTVNDVVLVYFSSSFFFFFFFFCKGLKDAMSLWGHMLCILLLYGSYAPDLG
jgi:hypothetical protein